MSDAATPSQPQPEPPQVPLASTAPSPPVPGPSGNMGPAPANGPGGGPSTPARRRSPAGCIVILSLCLLCLCIGSGIVAVLVSALSAAGAGGTDKLTEHFVEGDLRAEDKILRLQVHGVIMGGRGGLFSITESDPKGDLRRALRKAGEDEHVRAILLDIDSPGGGVTESDIMYQELLAWKSAHPKVKIVALFGDTAASGGYYVGSAADWIIAHPSTLTGSIGVILSYMNFEELMKKYGVKEVVYKSGAKKDIVSVSRLPTPEEERLLQGVVVSLYDRFVDVVAAGRKGKARNLTAETIRPLADGSVFTGTQALENGLVDEVGYLDDAIKRVKAMTGLTKARLVEYRALTGLLASLQSRLDAAPPEAALAVEARRFVEGDGARLLYLWRAR
ncbi:MAG: signal peptide peptidase SppA [Planctomycetes bacterium]|nr:signal peptide peptidase SppA [Planctomycetota bacterium]